MPIPFSTTFGTLPMEATQAESELSIERELETEAEED